MSDNLINKARHAREGGHPIFFLQKKAYTLVELAIVLGVTGVILSSIWSVAGVVWGNYKLNKTNQQIMTVVKNVREVYGLTGRAFLVVGDITANLNTATEHYIPSDMISGANFKHAMGGSFQVVSFGLNYNANPNFQIRIGGLPKSDCIKFIKEFPILTPEFKVRKLSTDSNTIGTGSISPDINPVASSSISTTNAIGWCPNLTNEVRLDFSLR